MKNLSKRTIAMMLACIFVLSALLVSCGENSGTAGTTVANGSANAEDTTDPQTTKSERESIPDGLSQKDFEGYTFRLYSYSDTVKGLSHSRYIMAEEQQGEVINDAIYLANRNVEERFNVKIRAVESGGDDVSHITNAKNTIKAGEDAFDFMVGHDIQLGNASLEGFFVNLYNVPNLDFSKPWWPANNTESLTLLNKMYIFSNAISYLGMNWTRVLFINKDKAKDYGLTIPYQDVFDGTWTLDKLIAMTRDVYSDVNGDNTRDKDDFYGYAYTGPFYCSLEPFGVDAVKKDPDQVLVLDINNECTIEVVNKMHELMFGTNGGYFDKEYDNKNLMFRDGKALFIYTELGNAIDVFRNSDVNYGILPMGKADESQQKYYAGYTDKLLAIPTTNSDLDRTGIIIEAMSAEAYKKVFPAYYEIALKNKFLQDEESVRVLDMIYDSRVLSFSYIFANKFNQTLTELFYNKTPASTDFASFYAKNEAAEKKNLEKVIAKFEALPE